MRWLCHSVPLDTQGGPQNGGSISDSSTAAALRIRSCPHQQDGSKLLPLPPDDRPLSREATLFRQCGEFVTDFLGHSFSFSSLYARFGRNARAAHEIHTPRRNLHCRRGVTKSSFFPKCVAVRD